MRFICSLALSTICHLHWRLRWRLDSASFGLKPATPSLACFDSPKCPLPLERGREAPPTARVLCACVRIRSISFSSSQIACSAAGPVHRSFRRCHLVRIASAFVHRPVHVRPLPPHRSAVPAIGCWRRNRWQLAYSIWRPRDGCQRHVSLKRRPTKRTGRPGDTRRPPRIAGAVGGGRRINRPS